MDMHTGIFALAIQLCDPVGGTIHIGLFNLSACAVRPQPLIGSSAIILLIECSNPVLQSLLLKAPASVPIGPAFAPAQPILSAPPSTKSNTAT